MFDKTQLLKGNLEGCILKIIEKEENYGYGLLEYLSAHGFSDITEGTIYPLLLRLEKQKLITGTVRISPSGTKRKYYRLTESGREYLSAFESEWRNVTDAVQRILEEGSYD